MAAAAVVVVREGAGRSPASTARPPASGWLGLVAASRPQVALGQRVIVLLRYPSLAERVRAAGGVANGVLERRWRAQVVRAQRRFLARLATRGLVIRPKARFTRVVDGFSTALDASTVARLERDPAVAGVYPVRAAFPAAAGTIRPERVRAGLSQMPATFAGLDGAGVSVAILDTGIDSSTPFLHGHVLPGIDLVGGGVTARPRARPGDPDSLERHGTEMAGIVVGLGAGGAPTGVAPDATVLPIRVAGWQRDAVGRWSIHARTDQVLAGLERAVDPDGNGDAHDAVRIALVSLAEPFAAFADGPLERAVAGALDLDTLVVAPAGNDGPAGPSFGSLSGPGGAPAALTVGAADFRPRTMSATLVVRAGLDVLLRRRVPVLSVLGPRHERNLPLVALAASTPLRDLFDRRGRSKVAGAAVLVPAAGSPREAAMAAVRAGAALVLLEGSELPAGGLGLGETAATPALAVPAALGARVRGVLARGLRASVSVGDGDVEENGGAGRVATFSSSGLGFGGQLKPDLVAPGVGVATSDPGTNPDGTSEFVSVSGSSAAAAVVAGEAAVLAQARPSLTAPALRALLVDTAHPLASSSTAAAGGGLVDVGAAASAEVVAEPPTLAFGRDLADGRNVRTVRLRNVSDRRLTVSVGLRRSFGAKAVLTATPRRLALGPGQAAPIRVALVSIASRPGAAAAGALTVAPAGGEALRIPWSAVASPVTPELLGRLQLSKRRFRPSTVAPAVLSLRAGAIDLRAGRPELEPVLRLDVELRDGRGRTIGLLARLRDVLPGRYAFGLTGRGPNGGVLKPGAYRVRVVAWPVAGGGSVARSVRIRIE